VRHKVEQRIWMESITRDGSLWSSEVVRGGVERGNVIRIGYSGGWKQAGLMVRLRKRIDRASDDAG
jgi:hypothetical protein